ncbi:MAG: hypothetical protein ACLQIQ_06805 [Beijerinckiaceae bacterium]
MILVFGSGFSAAGPDPEASVAAPTPGSTIVLFMMAPDAPAAHVLNESDARYGVVDDDTCKDCRNDPPVDHERFPRCPRRFQCTHRTNVDLTAAVLAHCRQGMIGACRVDDGNNGRPS